VTLVESGPDRPSQAAYPLDLADASRNSLASHDWGFSHAPTTRWGPNRNPMPRGRVVGGSSAVNTCIALRGDPYDYDEWADRGLKAWSFEACLPAFKRLERDLDFGDAPAHGQEGPLPIRRFSPSELTPWSAAFLTSAPGLGIERIEDLNAPGKGGAAPHPMNQLAGRRVGAAEAYLTPEVRQREGLTLWAETHVERILFEGTRAVGIAYRRGDERGELRADRIIVCTGAIQTPHLLLRSGVGHEDDLHRLGVHPVAHNPGVGCRLLDHPGVATFFRPKPGVVRLGDPLLQVGMRFKTDDALPYHDLQIQPGNNWQFGMNSLPGLSLMGHIAKPISQGRIRWTSADPMAKPTIHSNFFDDTHDLDLAVELFLRFGRLAEQPAMRELAAPLMPWMGQLKNPKRLRGWARYFCDSGYHPCGSVPMGTDADPLAATNGCGEVRGVTGLFVADASLMPVIPTCNIHIPTLMMAERLVELWEH